MISLHVIELALKAWTVVVLALLFSMVIGSAVGTVLAERRRGYQLPFEQKSNVRVIREDPS